MEIVCSKNNRKAISIFRLFLEHLVSMSAALLFLIAVLVAGAVFCVQSGMLLPANYSDGILNQVESSLEKEFDQSLLPENAAYALLDGTGKILDTDMTEGQVEKARAYFQKGKKPYYVYYRTIIMNSGDYLVVKYDMLAHFQNTILNRMIPYPEFTLLVLVLAAIVLLAVITALRFSKKLKQNLLPIVTATQKIEAQNLDFEIEPTKITEFNTSLEAIDQLKEALSLSLKKQWDDQEKRKSQLSALAHDIKTPLTVIKGNTELLLEENPSGEKEELISYIQSSVVSIEKYLELLMGVVNQEALAFHRKEVSVETFLGHVQEGALPLCKLKNIKLQIKNELQQKALYIDEELVKRAILNVIDNAVRYSAEDSMIEMQIRAAESKVVFEIRDTGKGFSKEALKKAAEQFYTEDISRTNHNYGLGLSFVKQICEMHGGSLEFGNRQEKAGARVAMKIEKV